MRIVPTFIGRLAHVVLCAELATRREFRGMGRDHPHLQDLAWGALHSRDRMVPRHIQENAADALEIAEGVWYDYMKPHIKNMLVKQWGADEREAERVIDNYFRDDSPTYDPNPRRARG